MNEQWMGVVRHVMTTIGAVLITMGVMDTGTWTTVSGAVLALVPIVWSWYSNSVPSMVSAVAESDEVERVVLTNARMAAEDPSPKVVAA